MNHIIDKMEKILRKILACKWLYYVLLMGSAILIYFIKLKEKLGEKDIIASNYYKYFFIIVGVIITTIITLLLINHFCKKISLPKKYLIFGLTLGLIYTFIAPIFSQSDESFHFLRAYQIAEGHFISPYNENGKAYDKLPISLYETLYDDDDIYPEYKKYGDVKKEIKIELNQKEKVENHVRAANYIFINYFPQSLGIAIGKIFNLSPYFLGVLGRLFNMIICTLILFIAISIIPIGKKIFTLIALTPTAIAYIASMSADGLVIATSALLIAIIIKMIYEQEKMSWKNYLLLLICIIFISTCKVAYLPLIGLAIFIPNKCFSNNKKKWLCIISLIIIGLCSSLLWMNVGHVEIDNETPVGLIKYVRFGIAFINTIFINLVSFIENIFAGNFLYQAQVQPMALVSLSYLVVLILSIFSEEKKLNIRYISKICIFGIAFLIIALISYALYAFNTDTTSFIINGIQGRYFLPLLFLLVFFIPKKKININKIELTDFSLLINFYVIVNMITVFLI